MNQCILMAEIIQAPELRYTSDTQTPVTEMVVQFPGLRSEDPASTLKVIGWGNLAQEIQEKYHLGDRILIEGRLSLNVLDRPEGFKETRAELTAQRVHPLGADTPLEVPANTAAASSVPTAPATKKSSPRTAEAKASHPSVPAQSTFDDIPF